MIRKRKPPHQGLHAPQQTHKKTAGQTPDRSNQNQKNLRVRGKSSRRTRKRFKATTILTI